MIEPMQREYELARIAGIPECARLLAAYREELLAASAQSAEPQEEEVLLDIRHRLYAEAVERSVGWSAWTPNEAYKTGFEGGIDATFDILRARLAMKRHLAAPAQSAEPQEAEAQRHEIRFIDATPDEGYIRRILEAYIDDSYYSDNTAGLPPENEVCKMMNKWREERNALLRAALARLASKPSQSEAPELDEKALADTAYGLSGYNPDNEWQNCRDMINHIQWLYHKHAGDSGVDEATENALASLDLLHKHYAARPSREEEMRELLVWALSFVPLDRTTTEQRMFDKARVVLAQGGARDEAQGEGKR